MKKLFILFGGAMMLTAVAIAREAHVDYVVNQVLDVVAKVKKADPHAVPMMFWDFDGTVIKGDISCGLPGKNGNFIYSGLAELSIKAGLSPVIKPSDVKRYNDVIYPELCKLGVWLGYPFIAQLHVGMEESVIADFAKREFEKTMKHWIFSSSKEIYTRLKAAGIKMHVISASPQVYVRATAETLGIPVSQITGIQLESDGGVISPRIVYPVSDGDGKAEYVRRIVSAVPHGVAVAGFGNSYHTDGPFLRYIVQTTLPGNVKPFALMINNPNPPAEYEGLFYTVTQDETVSGK